MGMAFNKREAVAVAKLTKCTHVRSQKALENLAKFAASTGLYDHDDTDDWEETERRHAMERQIDPVASEPVLVGEETMPLVKRLKEHQITEMAHQAIIHDVNVLMRKPVDTQTLTSADLDWQDPECHNWTQLHKHVHDRNMGAVQEAVEAGANLRLRDCDGKTPLGLAMNEGFMEIAAFLGHQMQFVREPAAMKIA